MAAPSSLLSVANNITCATPPPWKCKPFSSSLHFSLMASSSRSRSAASAKFGGDGAELKPEKKFITKEQEPEQYWQTAGERKGENPMMTPLPYIIIFGMSTPFVILAIAFANGWIKAPIR